GARAARGGRPRRRGAGVREAVRREHRLADAELAVTAGVQARLHREARVALGRVADASDVAASLTVRVRRAEPNVLAAYGPERAAAEAVTAVRRERAAVAEARVGLHVVELVAARVGPGRVGVLIVGALVQLRVRVRRDLVGVALVVPVAVVVAGPGILV